MRLPPIRITSSSGSRISAERGTTALTPNRINTSGISSAARPKARKMRLRSGRLAKRQMRRYRPKRQNATACSGTTQTSVVSAAENSSGGIARLKRSQYAPIQAKNAARMSCRMMATVRGVRFIWNTVPAPIDGQKDQEIYSGRQYKQPCGVLDIKQQGEGQRGAGQHQRIGCQGKLAMRRAEQHHPLIIMRTVRPPDSFSAQRAPDERHAGIDDERREHQQREQQRPHMLPRARDAQ